MGPWAMGPMGHGPFGRPAERAKRAELAPYEEKHYIGFRTLSLIVYPEMGHSERPKTLSLMLGIKSNRLSQTFQNAELAFCLDKMPSSKSRVANFYRLSR